jgi:hypothetical protein
MTALDTGETPATSPVHLWEGAELEPRAAGTIYKVAIGVEVSTTLARDVMQVTPHFRDVNGQQAPAGLATALATNMTTYLKGTTRGSVKVYLEDFNPSAPHQPLATATFGTAGAFLGNNAPRQLALCLSYYSLQNTKRYRGRLYIPRSWIWQNLTTPPTTVGERPTGGEMTSAMAFVTSVLKPGVQPAGNSWCVASHVDKVSRVTTDYWVDDNWDIIRSRGFRGATRQTGIFP